MALSPRKIGEGLYQPLAEINVTPLVDVMLVLLIIFMVTAPMLATGVKVNLPSAATAEPLETKDPVIVSVARTAVFRSERTRSLPRPWSRRSRRSSEIRTASSSCAATATRLTAMWFRSWTRWPPAGSPASPSCPARAKPRRFRRRPHDGRHS